MEKKWYEAGESPVDQAVEDFLRGEKKKTSWASVFEFLKGKKFTGTKKEKSPVPESSTIKKLRQRLANDPDNPYLKAAIEDLTRKGLRD